MVEFCLAKDGQRIFRWNGRGLCSQMQPNQEAERWCKKLDTKKIEPVRNLIVLGAGCGFHLLKLAQLYPAKRICVIEQQVEVITACESLHSLELASIDIVHIDELGDIKRSDRLKKILRQSFRIVEYKPAMITNLELYREIKDFLVGRTFSSLEFHLSLREGFGSALPKYPMSSADKDPDLLSIKDLHKVTNSSDDTDFHVKACINVLRELVK